MFGDDGKACDMVRVFMGQEDPVYVSHIKFNFPEGIDGPLSADTHVHEKMGVGRSHIDTIAAAAAGNTFKSHKY